MRLPVRASLAAASLALAAALAAPPATAALPVALLAKQMLHQLVKDQLRHTLESTLRGALDGATADGCGAGGIFAAAPGAAGGAMPPLPAMPGLPSFPGIGALQDLARLASGASRVGAVGRAPGGAAPSGPSMAEIARLIDSAPMSAEQRAQAMAGLVEMQRLQAESPPATAAELQAVLAEARALGMLEADEVDELSGCIANPSAAPMLGMIVAPLREAVDEARRTRDRLADTPVAQREAVVADMAAELRALDDETREDALAAMSRPGGVFPDWLAAGVRAALR